MENAGVAVSVGGGTGVSVGVGDGRLCVSVAVGGLLVGISGYGLAHAETKAARTPARIKRPTILLTTCLETKNVFDIFFLLSLALFQRDKETPYNMIHQNSAAKTPLILKIPARRKFLAQTRVLLARACYNREDVGTLTR
jgi:hypothetical protein